MKFTRLVARRTAQERQVIAALRGSLPARLATVRGAQADFLGLAGKAVHQGLLCFAPQSPFVSDGEIALLDLLGNAQRQYPHQPGLALPDDPDLLLRCALLLRDVGLWLPQVQPAASRNPAAGRRPAGGHAGQGGLARARALSLARSRQVASTGDFINIGISRQYVSRMCKEGHLQRVRHGWYRATPAAGDSPANP